MFSSEKKFARGRLKNGGEDDEKKAMVGVVTKKMQKLRRGNSKSRKN